MIKEVFIECIKNMNKAKIIYFSKKDQANTTRIIAPTDIMQGKNKDDSIKELFRFYDFKVNNSGHMTPKFFEDIISLEKLNEKFSINDLPNEILNNDWHIDRNWSN